MRLTRAAMRAQAQDDEMPIHEDGDIQEQEQADIEPFERPALKDITDGNSSIGDDHADTKLVLKQAKSKKKGRSAKDDTKKQDEVTAEQQTQQEESTQDITQQDSSILPSPTVIMEAARFQKHSSAPVTGAPKESVSEVAKEPMETPQKEPITLAKTPKFDPLVHMTEESPGKDNIEVKDDSFVDSIKSRSPSKLSRESAEPDSFVENIISRTPARRISRIEDSVEAMDALEDAIEEISESLPTLDHLEVESPVKTRKQSPAKPTPTPTRKQTSAKPTPASTRKHSPLKPTTPAIRKTALDTTVVTKTPKSAKLSPTKSKTAQLKSAPPRTTSGRVSTVRPTTKAPTINKSTSRPSNVVPKFAPKVTSEGEAPPQMSFSSSPAKRQPNVVKKRETSGPLSTSRPAFVPAKSSKPTTTSNFTLPGEAIAAKLKAQREERAKKEEEEKAKPTFKARPAPPKVSRPSVIPRENKASQARTSAIRSGSNKENVAPRIVPSTVTKPTSSLTVNKTRPDTKANSSIRRTTIPPKSSSTAPRTSLAPRIASLSEGQKLEVTKEDAVQQKLKGKEVFGRAKAEKKAAEKERREKEEAAKKARVDAAERGRQASREWAEKQKRKLEAQQATKTPTDGVPAQPAVAATS